MTINCRQATKLEQAYRRDARRIKTHAVEGPRPTWRSAWLCCLTGLEPQASRSKTRIGSWQYVILLGGETQRRPAAGHLNGKARIHRSVRREAEKCRSALGHVNAEAAGRGDRELGLAQGGPGPRENDAIAEACFKSRTKGLQLRDTGRPTHSLTVELGGSRADHRGLQCTLNGTAELGVTRGRRCTRQGKRGQQDREVIHAFAA